VHGTFLTPSVIEERKPLSMSARRAGWIGCNIRLDLIAPDAQIPVVAEGRASKRETVRAAFQQFNRLGDLNPSARGWATLTLQMIRSLGADAFSLDDLYRREPLFSAVYPANRNVRPRFGSNFRFFATWDTLSSAGEDLPPAYQDCGGLRSPVLGFRRITWEGDPMKNELVCQKCGAEGSIEWRFDAWARLEVTGLMLTETP